MGQSQLMRPKAEKNYQEIMLQAGYLEICGKQQKKLPRVERGCPWREGIKEGKGRAGFHYVKDLTF